MEIVWPPILRYVGQIEEDPSSIYQVHDRILGNRQPLQTFHLHVSKPYVGRGWVREKYCEIESQRLSFLIRGRG